MTDSVNCVALREPVSLDIRDAVASGFSRTFIPTQAAPSYPDFAPFRAAVDRFEVGLFRVAFRAGGFAAPGLTASATARGGLVESRPSTRLSPPYNRR